jgi:hypothetical protein
MAAQQEAREQLARAPVGMRPPELAGQLRQDGPNLVRARMQRATAIREAAFALFRESRDPPVADAPTHAIPGAELCYREAVALRVENELQSLVHRRGLQPGHGTPRAQRKGGPV